MAKHKWKKSTLTKIDPRALKGRLAGAVSQHFTARGTRVTTVVNPVPPSVAPTPPEPVAFEANPSNFDGGLEDDQGGEAVSRDYFSAQDNPLFDWREERDDFLNEFVRLDGRGLDDRGIHTPDDKCELCPQTGMYRCLDCHAVKFLCGNCLSNIHTFNPLHIIEKWDGRHFKRSSIRDAGGVLHLGHQPAFPCGKPHTSTRPFTIVHTNGIHVVNIAFCSCSEVSKYGTQVQQLLRRRYFPVTSVDPQTACTFALLKSAQLLSLQSKLSLYDYYIHIEALTDATGTAGVNDRYREFLRALRMWRHLKLLKRCGRSYDVTGVNGTSPGELAVLCPACPNPSINLPQNWRFVGEDSEYLYYLILGIDACFRFKRRQISSYEKDPELGPGYAYLVAWGPFSEYLSRFGDQDEMNTCSGLSAVDHANTKFSKGYATTGIVCVTCRHEFILPEGAAPLQKGEKFANVDYPVVKCTCHNRDPKKVLTYDIMCQWCRNLRSRLEQFPLEDAVSLDDQTVARLVPKFHLAAHRESCRVNFSLNYEPGVGRSDQEGPERTWFGLQGGGSTKDQGPGYWSDAMDDKFGHWNWSKFIRLGIKALVHLALRRIDNHTGALLAKKYINATDQSKHHEEEFAALSAGIPEDTLNLWEKRVRAWERDRDEPNPYFNPSSSPSELEIRKRLTAEEEAERLAVAAMESWTDSVDDYTETKYLLFGLDLEGQQRRLQSALASTSSETLPTSLIEQRTSFRRHLGKFRRLQARYQPEVIPLLAQLPATDIDVDSIQDAPLYLPSSLPPEILAECSQRLISMETELRIGQCYDSLDQLRTKLVAQTRLQKYKYVHVRNQAPNTRARHSLTRVNSKILALAVKYRHAFATLHRLDPKGKSGWSSEFLQLTRDNLRNLSEPALPSAPTTERAKQIQARSLLPGNTAPEGPRTVSWIWRGSLKKNSEASNAQNEFGEEFRLEWSKARARKDRWKEEVSLLREEMRRVLVSLVWRFNDWHKKGDIKVVSSLTTCPHLLEGLQAYAHRQALVFQDIHDHFLGIWKGFELPREGLTEPVPPAGRDQDAMEVDGEDA